MCLAALLTFACSGSEGGTGPSPIDRVTVTPTSAEVAVGGTVALTAAALDRSGADATSRVTISWSVTPQGVGTVTPAGATAAFQASGVGTATVRAAAEGRSASATIQVVPSEPPSPPGEVAASAFSDTEIDVTWTDTSDDESSFRIEREASSSGAGTLPPPVSFATVAQVGADVTSWRDSGLEPGASYRYLVRACNAAGCAPGEGAAGEADATTEIVVTYPTLAILTETLPAAALDTPYELALEASGGTGTFTWSVAGGSVAPPGLTLSDEGVLSGTPTETGSFPFTVQVVSGGQTRSSEVTLEVGEVAPPAVTTTELPSGVVGTAYDAAIEADGGDGTFAFEQTGGTLPPGVELSEAGAISGTPESEGLFDFEVTVTSADLEGTAELSIAVFERLRIGTTELPVATKDFAYEATVEVSGGDGSRTWSIPAGDLPPGLDLDGSTGQITGTATTTGVFEFTLRVESEDGQSATSPFTLEVVALGAEEFMPLAVGSRFRYAVEEVPGDGSPPTAREGVDEVVGMSQSGPITWYEIEGDGPFSGECGDASCFVGVDTRGAVRLRIRSASFALVSRILTEPVETGSTWQDPIVEPYLYSNGRIDAVFAEFSVGDTVFETVVDVHVSNTVTPATTDYYFARGVGLVRAIAFVSGGITVTYDLLEVSGSGTGSARPPGGR